MKTTTFAAMAILCAGLPADAYSVFWGDAVMSNLYASDGVTKLDDSYHFEVGAFDLGFDLMTEPLADWTAAWNVLDTSDFSASMGYFDSSVSIDGMGRSNGTGADTSYDFRGQKLYIWIYNDRDSMLDPSGMFEWAVMSGDDWMVPLNTNDPFAFPVDLRTDVASQSYFGAVDPDGDGANAIASAGGYHKAPAGAFDVQTYSVHAMAVPEVSSSFAVLLGAGLLLRRGRRQ